VQICHGDELLGQSPDTLEADGLFEQSIIIVTADHGLRPRVLNGQINVKVGDWTTRIPPFIHAPDLTSGTSTAQVQY
jgi:phosphoglycerol transferase MdoB-like AlkP superfamily enzyme